MVDWFDVCLLHFWMYLVTDVWFDLAQTVTCQNSRLVTLNLRHHFFCKLHVTVISTATKDAAVGTAEFELCGEMYYEFYGAGIGNDSGLL